MKFGCVREGDLFKIGHRPWIEGNGLHACFRRSSETGTRRPGFRSASMRFCRNSSGVMVRRVCSTFSNTSSERRPGMLNRGVLTDGLRFTGRGAVLWVFGLVAGMAVSGAEVDESSPKCRPSHARRFGCVISPGFRTPEMRQGPS